MNTFRYMCLIFNIGDALRLAFKGMTSDMGLSDVAVTIYQSALFAILFIALSYKVEKRK